MKVRYVIILCIVSCAIGAIFYPSKTIIKEVEVQSEVDTKLVEDLKSQVNSLEQSNKRLSEKTHTVIIERKDGSKRTEIKTESELFESREKEIKEKYEKELAAYQKEISELKEYKKTEINKKRFGIELGMLMDRSYYLHVNADLFGALYVGVHTQVGVHNTLGAGVGVRL